MMKGRDRNAPCWCNSGKKYKKCHLSRADQPKDNPWTAVEANRKAFHEKKCCARHVGLGACGGGVVKAHTVSRGSNLSAIAKDGHVLRYTADISELNKNGGKLSVKKIGIKDASVFYGFCGQHDRILFSCIENEPFIGRPDQCLAIAYRTMSRELYGKNATTHIRETLRGADKGRSHQQQLLLQVMLDEMDMGNEAAKRDLTATYENLTAAFVENRTDVIRSLVLELDGHLPFMFAGAWSPFTDLFGNAVQTGFADELLEQVFFSSFAGSAGEFICISWRHTANAPGKVIADQVQALPTDRQAAACLQIVMKHVENIFFNMDWFEARSSEQRKLMNRLAMSGVDSLGSPPSAPLSLDLEFQLPAVARSSIVGSRVDSQTASNAD